MSLLASLLVGLGLATANAINQNAQHINEQAKNILENAKNIYNESKMSLDIVQESAQNSILQLENTKKQILSTSFEQFLLSYDKIKQFQIVDHPKSALELIQYSCNEINIEKVDFDIHQLTLPPSLSCLTSCASLAFVFDQSLNFGTFEGVAGDSDTSFFSSFSAFSVPIVLFAGILSNSNAKENLNKAELTYSEAKLAVEKMQAIYLLYDAIYDQATLFNSLLIELNTMFAECVSLMTNVIKKKLKMQNKEKNCSAFLSSEELDLVVISRALAGAIKAIIDAQLLDDSGTISEQTINQYNNIKDNLILFSDSFTTIRTYDYKVRRAKIKPIKPLKFKRKKFKYK